MEKIMEKIMEKKGKKEKRKTHQFRLQFFNLRNHLERIVLLFFLIMIHRVMRVC